MPIGKDAVSSTKDSLDFRQKFSLTSQESFSTSRLLYAAATVTPPASRSVAMLGARSGGALELGPLATAACTASPDCGLTRTLRRPATSWLIKD